MTRRLPPLAKFEMMSGDYTTIIIIGNGGFTYLRLDVCTRGCTKGCSHALCAPFLQTFAAQLLSPATLCIDWVVVGCLLLESEDDGYREREQGCSNLWHLSYLFEL